MQFDGNNKITLTLEQVFELMMFDNRENTIAEYYDNVQLNIILDIYRPHKHLNVYDEILKRFETIKMKDEEKETRCENYSDYSKITLTTDQAFALIMLDNHKNITVEYYENAAKNIIFGMLKCYNLLYLYFDVIDDYDNTIEKIKNEGYDVAFYTCSISKDLEWMRARKLFVTTEYYKNQMSISRMMKYSKIYEESKEIKTEKDRNAFAYGEKKNAEYYENAKQYTLLSLLNKYKHLNTYNKILEHFDTKIKILKDRLKGGKEEKERLKAEKEEKERLKAKEDENEIKIVSKYYFDKIKQLQEEFKENINL